MRELIRSRVFWFAFAVGIALSVLPARAGQTIAQGVFCDKAEQVESYVRFVVEKQMSLQEALAATNEAAGSETACLPSMALVVDVEPIREVVIGDHRLVIVRLVVVGIRTPLGLQPVPPLEQFIAVGKENSVRPSKNGQDA